MFVSLQISTTAGLPTMPDAQRPTRCGDGFRHQSSGLLQRCFVWCCKNHYPTATDSDERCRSTCWWTWQVWSRYAGSTRHASLAADPATKSSKLQCLPSTVSEVPALRTSVAFAPHSLNLVEEWGFVLHTAGTYACHLRGQNLANAVSALLHPEHGTLTTTSLFRQPSADNSSSLGSKLISSNAPTYDFYLRELLRS